MGTIRKLLTTTLHVTHCPCGFVVTTRSEGAGVACLMEHLIVCPMNDPANPFPPERAQ